MKSLAENLKSLLVILVVVMLAGLSALRLMKIQVMGDKDITAPQVQNEDDYFSFAREVKSTRGEILDYNGNPLVTNDIHTDIVLQKKNQQQDYLQLESSFQGLLHEEVILLS